MKKGGGMGRKERMAFMACFLMIFGWWLIHSVQNAAAEIIHVGYTGPLSGGAAKYGQNNLDGLKMAVDEINEGGGISVGGKTYTLKVISLDDRYRPADTVTNARRLVELHKPPFIFCPHSGGILGMLKFNEQEGFILHGYTDNTAVLQQGNKWLVKAPMSMGFYNYGIMEMGWKKGWRKGALLCGTHEAGKMAEKIFEVLWKEMGGEIVSNAPADYGKVTDFYPYLTKVLAAKPDAIFLYGASEPSAMIISSARELGFKGGFMLGSQCKLDEMEKITPLKLITPTIGVCPVGMMPLPLMQDYSKRHEKKVGTIPTSESAFNYEVMYIFAEAMKKAETVKNLNKIMAAIPNVLPVGKHAIRGIHTMTKEGQFLSGYFAMEVIEGKFASPVNIDPAPWYKKYGASWGPK
jgi:branched-chain amino acid transport system substrate-binding protein